MCLIKNMKTDITMELMAVKMKAGEDPADLFRTYQEIENRYWTLNVKIVNEKLIAILIKAVPMDYVMVIISSLCWQV